MRTTPRDEGPYYGAFAFASVVVTCFAGYFFTEDFYGPAWMVWLSVFLCSVHVAFGILDFVPMERDPRLRGIYFTGQCALLTAMLWLSPIRGFFGIIVLPVASQAIFVLRRRNALLVSAYLYALNISIWAVPYGWHSGLHAFLNYAAAFAFTVAFTLITRRALDYQKREERLRRELEAANTQLREHAAQSADLATTRERNRLAREIHDGLGHYLTVVKTQLDAAAALLPADPTRARDSVTKAAHLAAEALDDVRRSVGSLRTDTTRPPLPEALRQLTRETGLPVAVRLEGAARPLPPGIEHALFRSAQEGLTNVRKHAAATSAELALDFREPGRVRLSVTDDGCGATGTPAAGFGLRGVRERIEVLGGRVESGDRPGGGYALTIEVPA
ncbi:MAG TPA: sensor histidine kinase [Lacunisphaera sp.]|jgi:signal transduction histidine kinase|nr:sensor histidine kinase [Lacunisphaera sp.]